MTLPPLPPVVWTGCYDDNWRDLIVPDAFAHPAKMARGLVKRIFDYLLLRGMLHRGDLVLDPFGGIGTTAIEGASRGMRVVCCELEPRFVELARLNMALHRRDWETMGRPKPVIVNGDSRYLRTVLGAAGLTAVVSSPPYAASVSDKRPDGGGIDWARVTGRTSGPNSQGRGAFAYGTTDGQLGALDEGAGVDAVISSPPYAEIATGAGGLNTKPPQHAGQQGGRSAESASQDTDQRYGQTEGQLARLPKGEVDAVVSSPPFTQGYSGGGGINKHGYNPDGGEGTDKVGERTYQGTGAEREPGNLETLTLGDVEAVVSSPPYEASVNSGQSGIDRSKTNPAYHSGSATSSQDAMPFMYGQTEGQIGKEQGETFWHAAQQVVRECYAVLKPGGVAVWVVKSFVRDKKLVDFPGDWRRLCEHAGFVTVEEIHASLVQEETIPGLFVDRVITRERKSFFRRLAEKKGSPRIDWEVIWVMRKP